MIPPTAMMIAHAARSHFTLDFMTHPHARS